MSKFKYPIKYYNIRFRIQSYVWFLSFLMSGFVVVVVWGGGGGGGGKKKSENGHIT